MPRTYESQVVDQQLGTGVDEDTDPRYSNKPDIIENAHYARSMQLSKRNGTKQIAQDGGFFAEWGAPTALGNLNRQLTHARSGSAFSLTDKPDADGLRSWVRAGPISRFKLEEFDVLAPATTYPPTMATLTSGGVTYRCLATYGRLMILDQSQRLIDACGLVTGAFVGGPVTRTMVLAWENGNKFVFLQDEITTAKLFIFFSTDASTFPASMAATAIITDLNDTADPNARYWDACIVGDDLYITYLNKNSPTDRITTKRYNLSSLSFTASVNDGGSLDGIRMVSVVASATRVTSMISSSVSSMSVGTVSISTAFYSPALTVIQAYVPVLTETYLATTAPQPLGGSVIEGTFTYHCFQTTYGTRMSKCSGATEIEHADLAGHIPLSKPFVVDGSIYQVLLSHRLQPGFTDTVETGATAILVEWTPKGSELTPQLHGVIAPVDTPAYRIAGTVAALAYPRGAQNAFVGAVSSIVADEQVEWAGVFGSFSEQQLRRATIVRMTRDTQTTMLVDGPDEASALISGGAVYAYDGTNTFPVAFTKAPALRLVGTGGGGGQLTQGGKYFFAAVFRYTDSKGNVYRSEVSVPIQVTMGATDTDAFLEATTFGIWQHQKLPGDIFFEYYVEIYRSVAGGATLFLNQTLNLTSTPILGVIGFGSSLSDSEISQRPVLYTLNGIKSQQPAKGAECIFFSGERAWCITATGEVYHSGFIISGDGFKFNLDFLLPPFGNDLAVAGGDLDGTPVIFRQREIWMVLGEGPDDSGIGNFTLRRVAADTGCDNPKSVVLTPDGLEFTYQNRMYILTRQGQLQRVSDSIQNTLAAGSVLAATRVPEQNEVRFLQGEQDDASQAVVQDLRVGTVQNPVFYTYRWDWDLGEADAGYATGAVLFEDQYTLITSQGNTFQDDPTTSLDASLVANKWVRYHVRGSWSKSAIQTFMRTWHGGIIYDRLSDCDFRVSIWNNYKPAETQSKTFTSSVNATWTDNRAMLRLKTQRGFAVRIEVSDAPPNGVVASPGTGIALAGFSFEGQVQGGLTRLPKGQRG